MNACCVLANPGKMMLNQRYITLWMLTQEFLILLCASDSSIILERKFHYEWLTLLPFRIEITKQL